MIVNKNDTEKYKNLGYSFKVSGAAEAQTPENDGASQSSAEDKPEKILAKKEENKKDNKKEPKAPPKAQTGAVSQVQS